MSLFAAPATGDAETKDAVADEGAAAKPAAPETKRSAPSAHTTALMSLFSNPVSRAKASAPDDADDPPAAASPTGVSDAKPATTAAPSAAEIAGASQNTTAATETDAGSGTSMQITTALRLNEQFRVRGNTSNLRWPLAASYLIHSPVVFPEVERRR